MRSDRLKAAREARQLTQKELGERVGVTDKAIWYYEKGQNDPSANVLTKLAQALEVSLDYLVGLVDEPSAHFSEDNLSADERRLIWAYRHGYIVEALETVTARFKEIDQAHVAGANETVHGQALQGTK